jgi:hypothetical protein
LLLLSGNISVSAGFQIGKIGALRLFSFLHGLLFRNGNAPLIQDPDGSLAYTVAIAPLPSGAAMATEADLVQVTQQTFGQGEGFTTGDVQAIPGGGIRINWTGRLSQGAAPPQPIAGKVFARQRDGSAFLLMVAATAAREEAQVSDAIVSLGSTLTVP